jgi:hypothetical protein
MWARQPFETVAERTSGRNPCAHIKVPVSEGEPGRRWGLPRPLVLDRHEIGCGLGADTCLLGDLVAGVKRWWIRQRAIGSRPIPSRKGRPRRHKITAAARQAGPESNFR